MIDCIVHRLGHSIIKTRRIKSERTGGTMNKAAKVVAAATAIVAGYMFVISLPSLVRYIRISTM